jgi:hypothetical protein
MTADPNNRGVCYRVLRTTHDPMRCPAGYEVKDGELWTTGREVRMVSKTGRECTRRLKPRRIRPFIHNGEPHYVIHRGSRSTRYFVKRSAILGSSET